MADSYASFAEFPTESMPITASSGIDMADRRFFANQAKMQALADMFLANQKQQAELQRYQGMTPGELSKSAYEGAQAQGRMGILPQLLAGEAGVAQGNAAKGRVDAETADSNIALSRSNAKTKMSANEVEGLANIVSSFHSQMTAMPMAAPELYRQMLDMLPKNARSQFPTEFTPKVMDGLGKMKQALAQTIPHLQKMEEVRVKEEGDTKRANISAKATVDAAATRATMRIKTIAQQYNEALAKGNLNGIISAGTALLNDPDVDDADKARIKKDVASAQQRWALLQGPKATPPIGSIPGSDAAAQRILEQLQGGQGAQTNTGIPGVTRK